MSDKTVLFDHDNYIDDNEWNEVLIEAFDRPIEEISDDEKWNYLYALEESDYNDIVSELDKAIDGRRLICQGTAQVWNGSAQGSFIAEDLRDAIDHLQGRDSGYIGFYEEDKDLHITFQHHDGTHDVIARVITEAGQDFIDEHEYDYDMSEWDMEKQVFENLELSEPISVW